METYLERTSWVKNKCKGQSTEYSRAIPSQPSTDTSDEAFESEAPELPSTEEVGFGKSNREGLTVIPKDGILEEKEDILAHRVHNNSAWS